MKLWYKKSIVFILAGISYIIGQYFRGVWFNPSWSYQCQGIHTISGIYCYAPYIGIGTFGLSFIVLGQIFALISLTSLLVGFILLFANTQVFQEWLRFSYWYVPIAILIIFVMYSATTAPLGGEAPIIQGIDVFIEPYIVITAYIVATDIISFVKRKLSERKMGTV